MLEESLAKLGFSTKERRVYSALVDSGRASAGALCKRVNLPRATVYSILSSLVERGVVSEDHSRGTTIFTVNSPDVFRRIVDEERADLAAKTEAAKDLEKMLEPLLKKSIFTLPKLQFFEGKQNIENMLYQYLPEWRQSMVQVGENTEWGYQDPTFVEHYRKWHDYLWRTMGPKEKIKLFSNASDVEKEIGHKISGREVRALPKGVQFASSIWIYGEYIIMASTREKPHYAYQLKDSVFGSNLRTIFQLLWRNV